MLEQTSADSCEEVSTEYENKEGDDMVSGYKSLIQILIDWILEWVVRRNQRTALLNS